MGVRSLLLIGILFHFIYVASIFDIYFRSPIVHGMDYNHPSFKAPARRLILFVGDGLRADRFFEKSFEEEPPRAPFLHRIIKEKGTYGVSHTRVPTESRPGHVAIIAGFYEDVSAVTKGWQENPVEFDSVFNVSRATWSFGSPDILPMFAKGAEEGKVSTFMYEAHQEDFATDATSLDQWVFEEVEKFLSSAQKNASLNELLHQDKIVFFLHLLGLDTNGHAFLPHSQEYLNNMRFVDRGVEKMVKLFEEFYGNDGNTAFIFTSDHGMNDRGAHGDGDPQNTETPLVAWGKGVNGPQETTQPQIETWGFGKLLRRDVNQADIAPLMATLIGAPLPKNSVGVLPLGYLEGSLEFKSRALFANAQEIFAQYKTKAELKRNTEIFFHPFAQLTVEDGLRIISNIEVEIAAGRFEEALRDCSRLIELSLAGLHYLQTYDWLFLRSVVASGYVGWMIFSITFVLKSYASWEEIHSLVILQQKSSNQLPLKIASAALFAGICSYLFLTSAPFFYYLYFGFALFFWERILEERTFLFLFISASLKKVSLGMALGRFVLLLIGLELLVASYFQREILSVLLILIALWPFSLPKDFQSQNRMLCVFWFLACLVGSIFPVLPVVKTENVILVYCGGGVSVIFGLAVFFKLTHGDSQKHTFGSSRGIILVATLLVLLSTLTVRDTTSKLASKEGLPLTNQILSWLIFVVSMVTPFAYASRDTQHFFDRIAVIFLSFCSPFVLLSISYEMVFYLSFALTLFIWLSLEKELHSFHSRGHLAQVDKPQQGHRKLTLKDIRTAFFFLLFINLAFFGTGNVASISSFNVASVTRFISVFNPFLMGSLLLFKISIPYFLLSAVFGILARLLELPSFSLFLLVLSITDVMTLNFFFMVKDSGSWLEIGTSISHFVIASAFIVVLILLSAVSHVLVGSVYLPFTSKPKRG